MIKATPIYIANFIDHNQKYIYDSYDNLNYTHIYI